MVNTVTMWKTVKVFLVLSVFVCLGEANVVRRQVSKDVSKTCYFCMGEKKDVDNIAACSLTDNIPIIEECSLDDLFDKCVVVQAFSISKNTTIFKRECTSKRFCEERRICSDPDFSDCRYECCSGDLCNNFNFADEVATKTPQPTVAMTTQKYQELAEGGGERVATENMEQTTVVPEMTTQSSKTDGLPTTRQRLSKTSKSNKHQVKEREEIVPVVEEGCNDLDDQCPSFADPSNLPMFCKDNDKYTSIACRKTCGFCIPSHEVTTSRPETISEKRQNLEDCKDKRTDCRDLKKLGYCNLLGDYIKKECSETCGICTSASTETKIAEAEKVMTSKLVFTDKVMTSEPVVTETKMDASTAAAMTTELPTIKPTTKKPTTPVLVQSGVKFQPTSENEDCQDKRDNCAELKKMNYCKLMVLFMNANCRKTCGVCSDAGIQSTPESARTETPSTSEVTKPAQPSQTEETTEASPEQTEETTDASPEQTEETTEALPGPTEETTEASPEQTEETTEALPGPTEETTEALPGPTEETTEALPGPTEETTEALPGPTEETTEALPGPTEETTKALPGPTEETTEALPGPTEETTEATTSQLTTVKTSKPTTSSTTDALPVTTTAVPKTNAKPTETTQQPQTTSEKLTKPRERPISVILERIKTSVQPKATSIPDTEDCQDKRDNCAELKKKNYCILMVFFMDMNCRKTCGFCFEAGRQSTPGPNTTKETTEALPGPTEETTSSTTSQRTTIKTSKPTTSATTEAAVPKTSAKPTEKITERTEPIETTARTTPKDRFTTSTVLLPTTQEKITEAKKKTTKSTPEPEVFTNKTTVKAQPDTKDCYDKRKECVEFAALPGYCDYNKDFMMKRCRKSCGFCSVGNKTEPPPKVTTKPADITSPKTTPVVTTKLTSRPTPVVTTEPSPESTTTLSPEDAKYEVVFVIGAREPNASASFGQQKKIIQEILRMSTLTNAKYGLVVYADKGRINFRLAGDVPSAILNELLNILPWQKDGSRVDKGIKKALGMFEDRPKTRRRIVAFINRPSDASYSELKVTREQAASKGVKLIVVGMGTGYDTEEFINMAPKYEDRLFFDSTGSSDIMSELKQAATDTVHAIMQEGAQAGIRVIGETIQILGPENPLISKYGKDLRWKIWPWGKCVDGKKYRVVRCYHLYKGKDYHVIIDACIEHVAKMPAKKQDC